ncbi:hypothetical protein D9756_005061 [Leucocoprinus leucothites]|uniref:NAD-P-binding protein n=1 Tax=Leucocoprinus leucothites TaxID=201217 RepID=A0A8H5G9A7_9AGAR|nr:hypothetical protein D9756_005061 [Leucoagaricus leucothites]
MIVPPAPRVWLITGASTGFGHAVACSALDHGEIVVATMRDPSNDTLASKYQDCHKKGKLLVLKLDVTDSEEVVLAFATAREAFGRIDVVFNNAGRTQAVGEVEQIPEELGRAIFDTNFWGAVNVSKESVKCFRQNSPPGGRLLQNSSGSALQGIPGSAYYSASKAALESFTEALAQEVDPKWNIRITIVEPGPFNTKVINEHLTFLPPHPAYTDPKLGVNISRAWMTPTKLKPMAGNVAKGAALFYRLSMLEDPPFRLPLHPRVLDRARHHIKSLQDGIDGYASWSDEIF